MINFTLFAAGGKTVDKTNDNGIIEQDITTERPSKPKQSITENLIKIIIRKKAGVV